MAEKRTSQKVEREKELVEIMNIRVTTEDLEALKVHAAAENTSVSEYVRGLIARHLNRKGR